MTIYFGMSSLSNREVYKIRYLQLDRDTSREKNVSHEFSSAFVILLVTLVTREPN